MKLLIVESPGKVKKIQSYLGADWLVRASVGHIRELSNEGDDHLGFELNGGVKCHYIPRSEKSKSVIAQLKQQAKQADAVILATDPDREGETIAWHLADELKLKNPQRVTYTEITAQAVKAAIARPRPLDMNLVGAGRCRDCLDKLVGYKGSPLVWSLDIGAKSVGRVQSATLHLLCQREREILAFRPQDYWSVFVDYSDGFRAFYRGSQTAAEGEEDTNESTKVLSQGEADRLVQEAQRHPHNVIQVEGKLGSKSPPAPFTTSGLQQAASSRQKFSPEYTMQLAQKLYEQGLITYMRTDSVSLSESFVTEAREWLQKNDPTNVPQKATKHRSKGDAQEAHEAIRPTDLKRSSAEIKTEIAEDEFKLYVLIWTRTLASQCASARIRKTKITTQSGTVQWEARGQVLEFPGYTKYWNDINADSELPVISQNQALTLENAGSEQKQTKPPSRYSEAKAIALMEKVGIGRPSTYAPTIKTLKDRLYVEIAKGFLVPTDVGMKVDEFLMGALPDLIESDFTAQMETQLDAIAEGKADWQKYLIGWNSSYFEPALSKAKEGLPKGSGTGTGVRRQLEKSRTKCPSCTKPMSKVPTKKVKKGHFLKCEEGCKALDGKDLVMFWSDRGKEWQLPGARSESGAAPATPAKVTEHSCPVCSKPLAEISYQKDGQAKSMLKCSDPKSGQDKKHKDVVYFRGKEGNWWSPKFGEIGG